ncbi:MAG TPA: flagellar hook-length control protein FliK [Candidatus Bathyarchaeia archaeon]|nr:flagellar hook-length control protein FliK [Candidatus Bathyarchaeia archaeon]
MYAVLLDMVTRSIQPEHAPPLRAGTVLHATVEGAPGRLSVVSGSLRVPLPDSAPFQPRQPVLLEVRETPQGLQLLVRPADAPAGLPQPSAGTQGPSAGTQGPPDPTQAVPAQVAQGQVAQAQAGQAPPEPKPDLAALLQMVAAALDAAGIGANPEVAAEILPSSLPRTEAAIRAFFAPIAATALLGDDWAALADLVARAVAAGAVPRRLAGLVNGAARGLDGQNPAELEAALAQAADDAVPLEARIAAALASDEPGALQKLFDRDLRALLDVLRKNEPFQSFLRESGQSKLFENLANRIAARLTEAGVQNVRSLDQPYLFLQIPCAAEGPFRRGYIHIMSGGGSGGREIDSRSATIAIDLSTARLGDLWITISLHDNRCACRICARSPQAVEAVRAAGGELEAALKQAGYARAAVHAVLWDGDRLRALADLMRPYSGLDVEA